MGQYSCGCKVGINKKLVIVEESVVRALKEETLAVGERLLKYVIMRFFIHIT